MNFGTSGYYRIETVQKRSEILRLAKIVAEIKPRNILEIGTCNGGTLFIWANLASNKVISCDIRQNKIKARFFQLLPPGNSDCEVIPLEGDSHDNRFIEHVQKVLNDDKVDFLFIDGDHSEEGAEADYNNYKHLVRKGGMIAFHDIVKKQPVPGNRVYYFWVRLKQSVSDLIEIVDNYGQRGCGIGVIKV